MPLFPHSAPATGLIRLKTLTRLRLLAVAGQLSALLAAAYVLKIPLPLPACLLTIGALLVFNLILIIRQKKHPLLHDRGAAISLVFDTTQLALLLHLTGGLSNPFIILMLAPMTVGAAILTGRSVIGVTLLGLFFLTLMLFFSPPLSYGGVLPQPFIIPGTYAALVISALFFVLYVRKVARESRRIFEAFSASRVELEKTQKIAAFGALAAAVAHELGSPLSTIAVVAGELSHALKGREEEQDIRTLQAEVARCKSILADFSTYHAADEAQFREMPLRDVLRLAAQPYARDGVAFHVTVTRMEGGGADVAGVAFLMHGLANIIQNAMHFARSAVTAEAGWQGKDVHVKVSDDGPGFAPDVLARLGQPFVSGRGESRKSHMGFGLFIAKTLLERTGATIMFANRSYSDGSITGAEVKLNWKNSPT